MNIISRQEAKEQGLKRYFTGKPCKHGHLCERSTKKGGCYQCDNEQSVRYYKNNSESAKARNKARYRAKKEKLNASSREYYEKHKERLAIIGKKWRDENKESIRIKRKKWRDENKDKICLQKKKYHQENKEEIAKKSKKWRDENKDTCAERARKYYKKNKKAANDRGRKHYEENKEKYLAYNKKYREENKEKCNITRKKWNEENRAYDFIRNTLNRVIKDWKGGRAKYEPLLGYTIQQLDTHLEKQFLKGMGWDNRDLWHIDHITPISHYIKEGIEDPAIINALSNLRPIWAKDNMSKGAVLTHLL